MLAHPLHRHHPQELELAPHFFAVLSFYMAVMIAMYDPQDMQAITSMLDLFPKDLMQMMGFSSLSRPHPVPGQLAVRVAHARIPHVYCIILGNRLVAKPSIPAPSPICLHPQLTGKIILTLGLYALVSVGVLFLGLFGMGVLLSWLLLPHELDIVAFLNLNITRCGEHAGQMIAFFFSCLFNDSRRSQCSVPGCHPVSLDEHAGRSLGPGGDLAESIHPTASTIYRHRDPGSALAVDCCTLRSS